MKKAEQIKINSMCNMIWDHAMEEFRSSCRWSDGVRLLSCQAWVYETESYYILRSYDTMVACIVKVTDTLIDELRDVYGYTATSAKHISKFSKSRTYGGYGSGKWGCKNILTYREV